MFRFILKAAYLSALKQGLTVKCDGWGVGAIC